MNPKAQRIAIAEACGWKLDMIPSEHGWDHYVWNTTRPDGLFLGQFNTVGLSRNLPDYLNDLNACHEMEKRLGGNLDQYVATILAIIHDVDPDYFDRVSWTHAAELTTATAAQRAEAFLKTLGKWVEDEQKEAEL